MADNSIAIKLVNGVEVSKNDDRVYRYLELANGLKVLVVSDPTTEQSAAALEVSVGHFSDPENIAGLAHFCEHMCFLGSEKYPDENSYSAFLNDHGGNSNAYTASEATNYHFCVDNSALREALDRFSTFFICPLFTQSATARELQAVDSEHKKNIQQDMWRAYQLDKTTSRPDHPYHKFGTGDARTLRDIPATEGTDVRAALLKFHAEHYSAGRMTLSILGAEPVDVLASWATEMFRDVKNNGSIAPVFPGHPHHDDAATLAAGGARVSGISQYVVPVKDTRMLNINWALPEQKTDWKSKGGRYLSHLLGHEGPGSILSHLKARGWATELYGGTDSSESGFSTFGIHVELSEEGLANVDDVQAIIYAYLGVLRAHGPQEWVHLEECLQAVASFRYLSKGNPLSYVTQLTGQLAEYPSAHAVSGPYLFWEWSPASVERFLACMTPRNARVRVSAKSVANMSGLLKEKWYGTEYLQETSSEEVLKRYEQVSSEYETLTRGWIQAKGGKSVTGGVLPGVVGGAPAAAAAAEAVVAVSKDLPAFLASLPSLSPPLTLPEPNDFLASDFELRNPQLKARAEAEAAVTAASISASSSSSGVDLLAAAEAVLASLGPRPSPTLKVVGNDIKIRRQPTPVLLRIDDPEDAKRMEVFFHGDNFFSVPKLYAYTQLTLPSGYLSPRAAVMMELYVRLLKEALNEYSYAASVAGLQYEAHGVIQGVNLYWYGWSHKLAVLAARTGEKAASLTFSDMLFDVQKDRLEKGYLNWSKESPYRHAALNATLATTYPRWTTEEKLAASKSITAAEMRAFIPELLRASHVRMLISGNATHAEALSVANAFAGPLKAISEAPLPSQLSLVPRVLQLPLPVAITPSGSSSTQQQQLAFEFLYTVPAPNSADPNAAMDMIVQIGQSSVGTHCSRTALVELAGHIISEPFYDDLRTRQQLGYIVSAGVKSEHNVESLRFIVQSGKVEKAEELMSRTENFLATYTKTLTEMTAEKFAANVRAVCIKRAEADKNAGQEANRLWDEVREGTLDFNRASSEVDALMRLTHAEFVAWYRECVAPGGSSRRVIAAFVERGTEAGSGGEEAEGEEEEEEEEVSGATSAATAVAVVDSATAGDKTEAEKEAAKAEKTGNDAGAAGSVVAAADGQATSPTTIATKVAAHEETVPSSAAITTTVAQEAVVAVAFPSVEVTLAQAGVVLHYFESNTHGTQKTGVTVDTVRDAFSSLGSASVLSELESALVGSSSSSSSNTIRVRVRLPSDGSAPSLMRAALPSYPDAGSVYRALFAGRTSA